MNSNMNSSSTAQASPLLPNKNQYYPYASPTQQQPQSAHQQRRYATPEESEATVPVFTTPTDMYLRKELNPIPRFTSSLPVHNSINNLNSTASASPSPSASAQYPTPTLQSRPNYQATQQHSPPQPPHKTSANSVFDPLAKKYSSSGPTSPTSSTSYKVPTAQTKPLRSKHSNYDNAASSGASVQSNTTSASDKFLAQLLDMGFSVEASKVAIAANKNGTFQAVLDTLLENTATPTTSAERVYTNGHVTSEQSASNSVDDSSDEEEDPAVLQAQEEQWKKEREKRRKEYLAQIRRNKPIPPTPNSGDAASKNGNNFNSHQQNASYTSSPLPASPPAQPQPASSKASTHSTPSATSNVSTPPPPPQTDPLTEYADKQRKEGNFLFNRGQFVEAEAAYTLAIQSLPADHGDIVLLNNNRAAARLKQGKFNDCLVDCNIAIDLAHKHINDGSSPSKIMSATETNMKSQLLKSLHRKACALEGLKSYESAMRVYEEYMRISGEQSSLAMQGIKRCQQAMQNGPSSQHYNAKWKPPSSSTSSTSNTTATSNNGDTSAFPNIDFNMFMPPKKTTLTKAEVDEINNSRAVKAMREREKQKEAEEAERLEKEDKVNSQIAIWKAGKEKNLRALLSSLEMILWSDVQWKAQTISDLVEPRKCKVTYMKAIAKVHPDKLSASATVEQRMLASGIFTTLNQAWDTFRAENNL